MKVKKKLQYMTLDELRIEYNLTEWHMTQILEVGSSRYQDMKNDSVTRHMWNREIAVLVSGGSKELERLLKSLVEKYKEAGDVYSYSRRDGTKDLLLEEQRMKERWNEVSEEVMKEQLEIYHTVSGLQDLKLLKRINLLLKYTVA